MLKHFTSLGVFGLLIIGCASKSGVEGGATGGSGGDFIIGGTGGTGNGGGAGNGGGDSTSFTGGKAIATQAILDQINKISCAGVDVELEVTPALLEFVIDVSGSMLDIPKGSTTQTKWDITKAALSDAILNNLPDTTGIGMLMFPNMSTVVNHNDTNGSGVLLPVENCVRTSAMVSVAPLGAAGSTQRAAIAQALASATAAGGTPTDDAFEYAYSMGLIPGKSAYTYYTPFMVLITDGQPTILLGCAGTGSTSYPVDWHPIANFVQKIYADTPTTKTFIVGSPGSDAQSSTGADGRPWLSMAARYGGTQITPDCNDDGPNYCHFDMSQSTNFSADLTQALKDIIKAAIPCAIKINAPAAGGVPDPTNINVVYKENVVGNVPTNQWLVGQTTDTTCANGTVDGWYVDPKDSTGTSIVLCPTTCKTVQTDKYAVLYVRQGCKTILPPPT